MGIANIRKWDEIQGMPIEGYEKRINADEVVGGEPVICKNPLKTVEEQVEQNCNYIDGIINNISPEDGSYMQRKMLEMAMLQLQRKRKEYRKKYPHICVYERELM